MLKIQTFVFNPFQVNTYILSDETKECIIIDPGCFDEDEGKILSEYILKSQLIPKTIYNTHGHLDHVMGNNFVTKKFNIETGCNKQDLYLLKRTKGYGTYYELNLENPPEPAFFIDETTLINFGNSLLQVLHVPGHSPGSVAFYSKEQNFVIVGDALFQGSIGRTDLPKGDYNTLINSIKQKLLPLADDCIVYCGHGPETTIGQERKYNSFLK